MDGLCPIWKGILSQSFSWKKLSTETYGKCNLKQEEQFYAERGSRLKNICLSKLLTVYLPFTFRKNLNKAIYSIYGNLLASFKYRRFPCWGEIKPPTPVLRPIYFQLQRKPLWLANFYSSLFNLPSHSYGQFTIGDNEKNKTIIIFSSCFSSSGKLPVRMRCQV